MRIMRIKSSSIYAIALQVGVFVYLFLGAAQSVVAQGSLNADYRINGKLVWQAFEPQRQVLQKSSAVVYTDGRSRIKTCYGVVVSADGYILTKASEIEGKSKLTLRIGNELFKNVKLRGIDSQWDVAVLKVEPKMSLTPVVFSNDDDVQQGHWLVSNGSSSRSIRRVRIGIASAITREIKSASSRVILGVMLSEEDDKDMEISEVTPGSGAAKAGVKKGDVVLSAGGIELKERSDLLQAMRGKKPGDKLELKVRRGKKEIKMEVELMPRPGRQRMTRNDQMSNTLSQRRDGFARAIQHDTPLSRSSVGGPLLNLDGECVGMNIARASRVATFAIPARELREIVERMVE